MTCNNSTTITLFPKPQQIKTVTGNMLIDGEYTDKLYKKYKFEIFANNINRFLNPNEFQDLGLGDGIGGFKILVGGPYTIDDVFKIILTGLKT